MAPKLLLNPETQLVTVKDSSPSISVIWDRAVQQAVIDTAPGPTIASRAYAIVHTAIFDAWAAYDETAIATQLGDTLQRPSSENTEANKVEAASFAAYRVLEELFPSEVATFDAVMANLGLDPTNITTDTTTPAGIGNVSAEALMRFRRNDGANQLGGYADTTGYTPVNVDANNVVDVELWTPEQVPISSPGGKLQQFLTPQWSVVEGFGLESPDEFRPVAPEPFFLVEGATVDLESQTITLADGTVLAVTRDLIGTIINPGFIAQAEEVIDFSKDLNDEGRLIAEFWEDGGGTSFPPGTWMTFGQFVSARDNNSLDEDVELFFTLGNAVFDAGVATWEAKVFYDYVRPIRAIRNLGELGLIGEFDPDLGGFAIEAYAGPGQGTQKILATDFITYQTPNADVSPPFAEYTSGHSAFSASAATVLELLSGSDRFGSSVTFQPGESRFDVGVTPAEELTLAWDTFSFAADEAGLSRLYGGIHFTDGDVNGRSLGQQIGVSAFETAQFFINGGEESPFLIGSRDGDSLTGSSDDEEFHGRSGSDVLTARAGDDALYGGDGDDSLTGNAGSDKLYGESGDDTLLGKLGDDQLFGGADVDLLRGAKGGDRLVGGVGDDTLKGNAGDDVLIGNNGDDTLVGGNGDDRLGGGLGDDTLTTGIGNDRVVIFSGDGVDTVTDFSDGSDLIVLADIDFSDITLSQQGSGTLISFGDESLLVLENVSIEQISETDFV